MIWKFPYYDIEKGIDWDGIEDNFDWFRNMELVPQDKVWHKEGNVQIHTKMVCDDGETTFLFPTYKDFEGFVDGIVKIEKDETQ